MNRIDGKIAVVTGGTQGLGAEIARRLAEAGAAGITDRGDMLRTDEALFDKMFAVNTRGPFFLMQTPSAA